MGGEMAKSSRTCMQVGLTLASLLLVAMFIACQGLVKQPPKPPGSLQTSINHIVVFAQENRSFDSYFGAMREYWAQNKFPDQAFDGLPQFNNPAGAPPSNPGCD